MGIYYVYAYYERDFNNPIYIGKGKRERLWEHFDKRCLVLPDMFHKKLGSMLIKKIPILVKKLAEGLSESEALELEQTIIWILGRKDSLTGPLYNMTDGGDNPPIRYEHTFDQRIKQSIRKTGEVHSKEWNERQRETQILRYGIAIESFNLQTGLIVKSYRAVREAARDGFDQATINRVLRGKQRHHHNLGWRYSVTITEVSDWQNPELFANKDFDSEI